jgi:acetolactate synthase-1/2/3 large subunit
MHEVIAQANAINDVPVVIDFRTDSSEKVFPMVASGASNDDIMVHPLLRGSQT